MSESRTFTKAQLEARTMLQGQRFWNSLVKFEPPMSKIPGVIDTNGVLTVRLDEILRFIGEQKAISAHAAIKAFLDMAFEDD